MSRRTHGLGSVSQRKDGRWWARGPRPARESLGVFDTEEEAEDARAAWALELQSADARTLPGATLRRCGERHLEEAAREHAPALASLRSRWKHIERAPFIDDGIAELRQPAIDAWARALRRPRGPLAPTTVAATLALLSGICGAAVRDGVAAANPCAGLRLPRERRTHEPWTYLLPDEQERLLAAAVPEVDHLLIAFALGTGLREGELFSLQLRDVDIEGRLVVVRYGSAGRATKGGRIRRVPLFGGALRALRRWLELLPVFAPENPRGLVWPGPKGGARDVGHPLRRNERVEGKLVARDGFEEALELAGIVAERRHDGRPVRWHDLRHTCCSSLVAGWWGERWPLDHVRELAGHSSVKVTERYAHLAHSVVAELGARTGGVRVGYAAAIPAEIPALPLNPYVDGPEQISRGLLLVAGSGTPAVPQELARTGLVALAAGDWTGAMAAADELLLASPELRDAAEVATRGEHAAEAAGRLFARFAEESTLAPPVAAPRGRR